LGELRLAADYTYQSDAFNSANPDPQPYDKLHSIENLDVSLHWRNIAGYEGLSGTLFVTNVTENHWATSQLAAYRELGLWGQYPAPPRMWGVTLRYDF
jgi:outer membrane receptor protein involved in Fe transport